MNAIIGGRPHGRRERIGGVKVSCRLLNTTLLYRVRDDGAPNKNAMSS